METIPTQLRAQKRQVRSHTKVPGRTIRRMALASNSTKMLASITATGKMVNATVKV